VSAAEEYRALRQRAGARIVARDLVQVRGPDAAAYLQGQCSQDVQAMAVGTVADALLLSPQGKLEALVRVQRLGEDDYVLDVDGGWGPVVRARLERFKLRVKAEITELALQCLALRGPDAHEAAAAVQSTYRVPFSWGGAVGVDLFAPALAVPKDVTPSGVSAWEALRVEAGVPAMGRELDERTIAAEAGLLERAVSFTKGCYTGQELVARLDARGNKVARRLAGLVVEGPVVGSPVGGDTGTEGEDAEPLAPGTAIVEPGTGRELGTVTSSARSPALGVVALGYLHRRVSPPAPVELHPPGSAPRRAEARPLPLLA
jgi:folate-binding protein YgfZ